jgi:hypothetical protein
MNTPKTHPLNVSYLVVGLVFLGIAGSWALHTAGVVDSGDARWLLPAVLLLAGTVGLVAFAAKGIGRRRQERESADAYSFETVEPLDVPWTPYEIDTETDDQTGRTREEDR